MTRPVICFIAAKTAWPLAWSSRVVTTPRDDARVRITDQLGFVSDLQRRHRVAERHSHPKGRPGRRGCGEFPRHLAGRRSSGSSVAGLIGLPIAPSRSDVSELLVRETARSIRCGGQLHEGPADRAASSRPGRSAGPPAANSRQRAVGVVRRGCRWAAPSAEVDDDIRR